mgnify:CR=1 FL=1
MRLGFRPAAREFYRDLEADNSREWWQAHRDVYEAEVRAPLEALLIALGDEFGDAKVYRPNRDVRFSRDKSPYKTHQGATAPNATACGWYLELSATGLRTGGGFYTAAPAALAEVRARLADERGEAFAREIAALEAEGWERRGDRLKTHPRGADPAHPRIDLLRHRSLWLIREVPHEVSETDAVVERVRADWRRLRAVVEWCGEAIAAGEAREAHRREG